MAVDVIVVNYKTNDLRDAFIQSYKDFGFGGCTLTYVDVEAGYDGGDSGTDFRYFINRIVTQENIGYARACNQGAQYGDNDVILLANADTLLSDGFRECHDALMSNPTWGVLGPRQVNEFGRITAGGIFGTDQ
jgi:hypothetical protein